jgi:hypothetical protein
LEQRKERKIFSYINILFFFFQFFFFFRKVFSTNLSEIIKKSTLLFL